jgi:S-adenosylmethionine decarboxylase
MKVIDHPIDYGNHIILDLYDCDESKLFFANNNILSAVDYIVKSNHGTIESSNYHIFPNDAYTLMLLLSESHLTIHTFPENNYVSIDVYTCGSSVLTFNIATNIIQYFNSKRPIINHIIRNNFNNSPEIKYNINDYIIKKDDKIILLSGVKIISNMKGLTILLDGNDDKYVLIDNKIMQELIEDKDFISKQIINYDKAANLS